MECIRKIVFAASLAATSCISMPGMAANYRLTLLDTGGREGVASRVNNNGSIGGTVWSNQKGVQCSQNPADLYRQGTPFLIKNGLMTEIGAGLTEQTCGVAPEGNPLGLNDSDVVVGRLNKHAFRYQNGFYTDMHNQIGIDLPEYAVYYESTVYAINNSGVIGGQAGMGDAIGYINNHWRVLAANQSAYWQPRATAVNDIGAILINGCGRLGCGLALYQNGALADVSWAGGPPYNSNTAADINNLGHIVYTVNSTQSKLFRSESDIVALPGGDVSAAPLAMNNADIIVGTITVNGNQRAALLENGVWVDLNAKVGRSNLLFRASDINDVGVIVGATKDATGLRPFVLAPEGITPIVYARGTFNTWGLKAMERTAANSWQTTVHFGATTTERFKFDVSGDWSTNYGDTNKDGVADLTGSDIMIAQREGDYRITFNDLTKQYTVVKQGMNQAPSANAGPDQTITVGAAVNQVGSGTDSDGSIASYQWKEGNTVLGTSASLSLSGLAVGVHTLTLTVTDSQGATGSDTAVITVNPAGGSALKVYLKSNWATPKIYYWNVVGASMSTTWPGVTMTTTSASNVRSFSFNSGVTSANLIFSNNGATQTANLSRTSADTNTCWNATASPAGWTTPAACGIGSNQAPIANAGPAQTVSGAATVTLDGSASTDPDGSIASYQWTQTSGPAVTIQNATQAKAQVSLPAPTTATLYTFKLTVTDNLGATNSATTDVQQTNGGFQRTYPQVHFRGTPNMWVPPGTKMNLVANYLWEISPTFGASATERFKFDIYGDWTLNFGDNDKDGTADQSGADISIAQGAGVYKIQFNDQTKKYTVVKQGALCNYATMNYRGTSNAWAASAMGCTSNNLWQIDVTLPTGGGQFKFDMAGDWKTNWGDTNKDGIGDAGGANIVVTKAGTYRISFNETTKRYDVLGLGEIGGVQQVLWSFNRSDITSFTIDVSILSEPSNSDGLYYQMYQSYINGIGMYFGIQTNVSGVNGESTGKGLIFSRWGTRDLANARTQPGGWSVSAGTEGDFIGVRLHYDWTVGRYRLKLAKMETDAGGDWYGVWITNRDTNVTTHIGDLRFAVATGANKPGITDTGYTWTELYYKAQPLTPMPSWHVTMDRAYANDIYPAVSASSGYSPNLWGHSDTYYDAVTKMIHFQMGQEITRTHPEAVLY